MLDKVKDFIVEINDFKATTKEELETFRIKYIGKKGILNDLFAEFKTVPNELKKEFGQALNAFKTAAENKVATLRGEMEDASMLQNRLNDLTRPAEPLKLGSRHPISIVKNQIIEVFSKIGFTLSEGPEIEDDWHNFTALNLLRTHTSSVQTRYMENNEPPIRTLSPGRVFRNEDISARAHCIFHQVEGLYIDTDVSFADLKQTLLYFTKEMFGKSKIRLRPSYFPMY